MSTNLGILRIGKVDPLVIEFLQNNLLKYFIMFQNIVLVEKIPEIPKKAYNQKRGQYLSTYFLNIVKDYVKKKLFLRAIGVTSVDLFVPNLNFVFGVARSRECIISIHRLYTEFYGDLPNQSIFLERTLKEAIHEIGHTLGLKHCSNKCIMRFSNSIFDTDNKPKEFCPKCLKILSSNTY
ncbi:MAG: archaemetzincin family Zn-dependent metalloprotease [Candidatus Helarchaeota archaeon]